MPDLLDREARAVFSPSLPDLGEGEFSAVDGNQEEIPPEHYDKASGMSISYVEPGARELGVSLSHGRSEAEGDAQKYCAEGLEGGYYLECAVDARPDGSLAISKLWALRPLKYGNLAQDTWHAVTSEQLTRIDPAKLWFERSVKVVKSETFVTYVNETVKAPSREAAERLFAVPVADLVELGTDPQLVIPHPPPDPGSGCDAWMLPDSNVTCGRSGP